MMKGIIRSIAYNQKYQSILQNRSVYFAVELLSNCGFTDQLHLFATLYKIGKRLGLKYFHIPVEKHRFEIEFNNNNATLTGIKISEQFQDAFDFIGFNQYFIQLNDKINLDEFDVFTFDYTLDNLKDNNIDNVDKLIKLIKIEINSFAKKYKGNILVKLCLHKQNTKLLRTARLPHSYLDFDFYEIYSNFRRRYPWPVRFNRNKPKILIHARQGDTATIETPWKSFIQVWPRKPNALKEFDSIDQLNDHQIITPSDYHRFCKNLFNCFDKRYFSTLFFSDGYHRSINQLYKYRNMFDFSDKQWQQLDEWKKSCNSSLFSMFTKLDDFELIIGEETEKLYDLIHSFFFADILIVGNQQRMMPKFYAYFCRYCKGPLVFVLYKKIIPNFDHLGNPGMMENYIFVDLDKYDIQEIFARVKIHLETMNHTSIKNNFQN